MALLLAPYNDSMRLGMGYNSYTQTACIDKAVLVSNDKKTKTANPSQVVNYSSRFVERLSDIADSLNISYSNSIKRGTVEIAGNGNSINEDKIKASDLNAVVSVKVVNQTETIDDNCEFQGIDGVEPGTSAFNDTFGDCYISGFIEGGDFTGIISMRVLDRSKTEEVKKTIRSAADYGQDEDFSLDGSFGFSGATSEALKQTETTISVSWMGGGQVKSQDVQWDINSVFDTAAAFPAHVAECPQRTWAILTRYSANRSFKNKAKEKSHSLLRYDAVMSYTAELFENFMEYKQLIKAVQDIISNPTKYKAQDNKNNAITTSIPQLVAVKSAFRGEMQKIVSVVDLFSKDPDALHRSQALSKEPSDDVVRKIMRAALKISDTVGSSAPAESNATARSGSTVSTASSYSVVGAESLSGDKVAAMLNSLLAPEIWIDVLPVAIEELPQTSVSKPADAATMLVGFPPAPTKDDVKPVVPKLTIHAAVCGVQDCTDVLRSRVDAVANTLTVSSGELNAIADDPVHNNLRRFHNAWRPSLAAVYSFGSEPKRILIIKHEDGVGTMTTLKRENDANPLCQPTEFTKETYSIVAIIFGAKLYTNPEAVEKVKNELRSSYDDGRRVRTWNVNGGLGDDPWWGVLKTGILFYTTSPNGTVIRSSCGVDSYQSCTISSLSLPDKFRFRCQPEHPGAVQKVGFDRNSLNIRFDHRVFLAFDNGVVFFAHNDANFALWVNGQLKWHTNTSRKERDPAKMSMIFDGNMDFAVYHGSERTEWRTDCRKPNTNGRVYFSNQAPYIEIWDEDAGVRIWKLPPC